MINTEKNSMESHVVKLAFWTVFLNSVIESFLFYFDDRYSIIILQLALNLIFFGYLNLIKFPLKSTKKFIPIILLILYFVILSAFSSDPFHSYNMLLKFSIPIVFLVVGFSFNSTYFLYYFLNHVWVFLLYFALYFLISNYFEIGNDLYRGGFSIGYNSLNGLYIPIFCIIVILFFYNKIMKKSTRIFSFILSAINVVIYFAILKRTLLILLFMALIIYLAFNLNIKTLVYTVFFIILTSVTFYYFFYEGFQRTLESRHNYFDSEYDLTSEGRFTENFYVFSIMKEIPLSLIFGTGEVFNDRKYISFSFYERSREIHNSYARIFWNGGIIGLLLFLYFYWIQGKVMIRSFSYFRKSQRIYRQIFLFGFVLVFLRLLNDFSSGITYLGFNAFSYLLIGYFFKLSSVIKIQIQTDYRLRKRNQLVGYGILAK